MSQLTYEAAVYSRVIKYKNYKNVEQTTELFFALDPLQLMQVIATFQPKKSKSANPAKKGQTEALTEEENVKFVRDLAAKAAGWPSDDGESWEPFENFGDTIAGKAFLTKLVSSDGDRLEFAQKVILDPFRAFVDFAKSDPTNNKKEVSNFETMLKQLENIFEEPKQDESLAERKVRLAAELAALETPEEA